MVYGIWRLFPFHGLHHFEFLYIIGFTTLALGLIYGIDSIYKRVTKSKSKKTEN